MGCSCFPLEAKAETLPRGGYLSRARFLFGSALPAEHVWQVQRVPPSRGDTERSGSSGAHLPLTPSRSLALGIWTGVPPVTASVPVSSFTPLPVCNVHFKSLRKSYPESTSDFPQRPMP